MLCSRLRRRKLGLVATWFSKKPPFLSLRCSYAVISGASDRGTDGSSSTRVILRPYQEECIQAILGALREDRRQVGVSLATGSGKTVIFTELISRVVPPNAHATKTLILVHRRELVEQAAKHSSLRYPRKIIEIEMGSLHASGDADITVASIQSIVSRDRVEKFKPETFKLVLVDEAHHIVSPGYLKILGHFGFVGRGLPFTRCSTLTPTPALVGVSATLSRLDGLALGKVLKHIVFHKDFIDLIGEKWLSEVIFTTVASKVDLSHIKNNAAGDFLSSALSKAVSTDEANLIAVRAWQHRAVGRKSTIVFCVDLNHVISLTNAFRAHGVDARFITGETSKNLRSQRLDDFRSGDFPVLVNCGVFTEGTDIPNIDCVLLARPTRSRNLLVQMIGRGMRLHPGKYDCHIIDMVASLKSGIVTTPTLFGLDPFEVVQEANAEKLNQLKALRDREIMREQAQNPLKTGFGAKRDSFEATMTFTDYESVTDLIEDSSSERHIRAISPHAWVQVGEGRYVLMNGASGSYLILLKVPPELYEVRIISKLHKSDEKFAWMRPGKIVTASTFEAAVHGGDSYAAKHFTRQLISTFTKGGWRKQPASRAQVDFLNKYRDNDDQLTVQSLNKGKAGDMITKIRFGAKGRLKQVAKEKRKAAKEITKRESWEALKIREDVKVGPAPGSDNKDETGAEMPRLDLA